MFNILILYLNMVNCFSIHPTRDLRKLLEINGLSVNNYDTCLETNRTFMYTLKNGTVLLLPNSLDENSLGIRFENRECFNTYLLNDRFPIENDNKEFVELYQNEILNINSTLQKIFSEISGVDYKDFNTISLEDVFLYGNKLKQNFDKLSERERFNLILIVGEAIKRRNNGEWILLKKYGTFNPYFTIGVLNRDSTITLFVEFSKSFFVNKTLDLSTFVELPYIKQPTLKLHNDFFKNNYKDYRVIH